VNPRAAQTLGAGVACIVIAIIVGLIGYYGITTGELPAGGFMVIAAAVIGLVGLGCVIGGGVMAGAATKP
jgi:hypothetical protein